MNDLSQRDETTRLLDQTNIKLKQCWLHSSVFISPFNPPRSPTTNAPLNRCKNDPVEPMNRFVFQDDAFTALDGELTDNNVRIIYNSYHLHPDSYEWAPLFTEFMPGTVVPIQTLCDRIKQYVDVANNRFA